jgi:hypothetical protein
MVLEVAGRSAEERFGPAMFVQTRSAKTGIRLLVVMSEIEAVLDERGAKERVVANAIAPHPGIEKRKGKNKSQEQKALGIAVAKSRRRFRVL